MLRLSASAAIIAVSLAASAVGASAQSRVEAGVQCPLAMTYGAAAVLRRSPVLVQPAHSGRPFKGRTETQGLPGLCLRSTPPGAASTFGLPLKASSRSAPPQDRL